MLSPSKTSSLINPSEGQLPVRTQAPKVSPEEQAAYDALHPLSWIVHNGCWHLPVPPKRFHWDWCELAAKAVREHKNLLLVAPVGFGKTAIMHGFSLWYALEYTQGQGKLLLVGETDQAAMRRSAAVKAEIEGNPTLNSRWPGLIGDPWTSQEFNLGIRVDKTHHSRSFRAVGTGGQLIQARADLILADDMVSIENQWTAYCRSKVHDWFHSTLKSRLEPTGSMIAIGTRKDALDLYSELMDSDLWMCPKDWYSADYIGDDGELYSRWPELWPSETLRELYRDEPRTYGLDRRGIPLSRGSKPFEWDHIQRAIQNGSAFCAGPATSLGLRCITQAWDVAGQTESTDANRRSDYFACATVGYDAEGRHVIAEVWRERHISPTRWCEEVRRQYDRHRPERLYCETNAQQGFHLALAMKETGLPMLGHNMQAKDIQDLTGRTAPLCAAIETGRLVIPSGDAYSKDLAKLIAGEMVEFPGGGHDDVIKSIYIADRHLTDRAPTSPAPRGVASTVAGISRGAMPSSAPRIRP